MKVFEQPEINLIPFEVRDILTTSGVGDSSDGPIDPELPGDDFE